jgi:UDP-glucose 4-epimerase
VSPEAGPIIQAIAATPALAGKQPESKPVSAQRVLITGGAGLIGSHIADFLIRKSMQGGGIGEIVVLDNFVRGRRENLKWAMANGPVTILEGDIRDRQAIARAMEGVELVFHQAALRITQSAEDPRLALEVLVDGTYNVLEAASQAGVRKVVAASSASVYGLADEFPTPESQHPYNNRTFYGAAKAFNEGMLRSCNEMWGLDYVALRYFNVYGPRMDIFGVYTEVLIRWMELIARGQPPQVFGSGEHTMDFVYAEDIARANVLAAESQVTDEVFNIGSGAEISLNELASVLLEVMGSGLKPEHQAERKVNPVPRRLADTSRAKHMLGFEAQVSLREGLRRLVDWWTKERTVVA